MFGTGMVATKGQQLRELLTLVWHGVETYTHVCQEPRARRFGIHADDFLTLSRARQTDELPRMTKNSSKSRPAIVQEKPEDAPSGWAPVQHRLAASSGLSILLVNGR